MNLNMEQVEFEQLYKNLLNDSDFEHRTLPETT